MAQSTTLLQRFLGCSVCTEDFTDPLTLSCSHSFCSDCIKKFWEQGKHKTCPISKRKSLKDPVVNFALKELAGSFTGRIQTGSSETEKGEKEVEYLKNHEEPKVFCKDEGRAVSAAYDFPHQTGPKAVPIEPPVRDLKEQLKSDLKSLQEKRDKYKHVEETYIEVIQHSKKQLLSTERKIRDEFNKLHQFLREEEESRLAALKKEKEQKRRMISREMKKIQEQISSLSDTISAVEKDLQKDKGTFLSTYTDTQSRARVQVSVSDPQLVPGALIDVAKYLGNLSFRVWEKMKDRVHFSPVILDSNTAAGSLSLSDDLTRVRNGDRKQQLPDNPERNTYYVEVLGSEGFSSGKHSWEVEVGDHPLWSLGLANEPFYRKGERSATPEDGLWITVHTPAFQRDSSSEMVWRQSERPD